MTRLRLCALGSLFLVSLIVPVVSQAQAEAPLDSSTDVVELAKVTAVANETTTILPGTETPTQDQTLTATVTKGPDAGQSITFDNNYTQLSVGDAFYIHHETDPLDGIDTWSVSDVYRIPILEILVGVFIFLIIIFGGIQGVRGFASLCGSFILIFYALVPGILQGYSPVWVGVGVAGLIIVAGSYITHGFNKTTSAAVLGMIATVIITGLGAWWVVHAAHLSGYTTEENVYLNFDTHGTIDMVGLLFAGIMIGLLGVLYDIAIGQAVAVEELSSAANASLPAGRQVSRRQIFRRAIRIGREHIGALVNTLAIAYVGAALPLLLLSQSSTYGLLYDINSELFATEIIRILIGSIGLILGVPITTLIASYLLTSKEAVHS